MTKEEREKCKQTVRDYVKHSGVFINGSEQLEALCHLVLEMEEKIQWLNWRVAMCPIPLSPYKGTSTDCMWIDEEMKNDK